MDKNNNNKSYFPFCLNFRHQKQVNRMFLIHVFTQLSVVK